ncbi:MAG: hypothetical protein Q7J73_00815 [Dehalococcoidales bacterium]|nr:hypothetical protein [Dehalococcoidales bacterium]
MKSDLLVQSLVLMYINCQLLLYPGIVLQHDIEFIPDFIVPSARHEAVVPARVFYPGAVMGAAVVKDLAPLASQD